jgi:hypothetical protein
MSKLLVALAVVCVACFSTGARAAAIISEGAFTVDVTEPPQPSGSGFFEIRSPYFNPNAGPDEDPRPPSDWAVLDFEFTFEGVTWDETDITSCECYFDEFGNPLGINFAYEGPKGTLLLSWNFEDGNFGFQGGGFGGTSEDGDVGGAFDSFEARIVPEPGAVGLISLGLVLLALGTEGTARRWRRRPRRSTR